MQRWVATEPIVIGELISSGLGLRLLTNRSQWWQRVTPSRARFCVLRSPRHDDR
jgi:hypothetical protein